MRSKKDFSHDADPKEEPHKGDLPPKENGGFMSGLKKVGFTVWLAVMVIGGALAFLVALFLV